MSGHIFDHSVAASGSGSGSPDYNHFASSSASVTDVSYGSGATGIPGEARPPITIKRVGGKANVSAACGPCKRAHLACDVNRPCRRCSNMGKEDMCEDVPHKKRGRPKVPKTLGIPYARRPPAEQTNGRWRPAPQMSSLSDSYPPSNQLDPRFPTGSSRMPDPGYSAPGSLPSPPLFTIFTSTDLCILRCSPTSYNLTGYPPQDFVNVHLLDWVHPSDRHLLEMEHNRLLMTSMGGSQLHTDQETQAAISQRSERDLLTPVQGMREPYPNQNVRIVRADHNYSFFNVRLHLGGGLGGSLWHAHTHGKVYFVISLLLLPPQARGDIGSRSFAPMTAVPDGSRRVSYDPPTPITPTQASHGPQGSVGPIPGYPSMPSASGTPAGYEYETVPVDSSHLASAPVAIPGNGRQLTSDMTTPTTSTFNSYPRAVPAGYPPRSPSPPRQPHSYQQATHQAVPTPESYSYNPASFPGGPAPQYANSPHLPPYPDQNANGEDNTRRSSAENSWQRDDYPPTTHSAPSTSRANIHGMIRQNGTSSSPMPSPNNGFMVDPSLAPSHGAQGNAGIGYGADIGPPAFAQDSIPPAIADGSVPQSNGQEYTEYGRRAWEL